MKKIKQLNLMQTKEKLSQRKTISHLVDLKTEAEKCRKVSKELEEISLSYPGVLKSYAIQAGRELRVVVESENVSDSEANKIC